MFFLKIIPVIIWYNPKNVKTDFGTAIDNIKSYSDFFDNVIIVDNSSEDNTNLAALIPNSIYIPNLKNMGIAKAQNIGCEKAIELGYNWCMTMDQDSHWEKTEIQTFLKAVQKYSALNNFYSFGPRIDCPNIDSIVSSCLKKSFAYKLLKNLKNSLEKNKQTNFADFEKDFEFKNILFSSGNIFSLQKWKEVGKFREDFFIDQVDHDFCLKLNSVYPNSIIRFTKIKLNHNLGTIKKTFFSRLDFHDGVRLYYCVRNTLYLTESFPDVGRELTKGNLKIFFQNLRDFKFSNAMYMIKGYLAYKKRITGKYNG